MENGLTIHIGDNLYVTKSIDGSVITVGDESVDWAIKFGRSLMQYKYIDDAMDEEDGGSLVGLLATIWFNDTNIPFDEEYMREKDSLLRDYMERVKKRHKEYNPQEARAILSLTGDGEETSPEK